MKYSITFANNTERQFYGKTTDQIEKLVEPRQGINASVREATFGGNTFFFTINPTESVAVAITKHIYKMGEAGVTVIAVVKEGQAILMPMTPKDLKIVTALLSAYINVM
mgnify:CR=1 FL=1